MREAIPPEQDQPLGTQPRGDDPEDDAGDQPARGERLPLLEVGRVVKPHGLRGEVVVEPVTNRPEQRFTPGSRLETDRGPVEVVSGRPHQHRWLVSFAGVGDRDAAEALRGVVLRGTAIEEQGALWVHELVGSEVRDQDGRSYGPVEAVEANPASDLLVLAGERLVPLVFVVDQSPGVVVIDPPPGLLDED